ncbi:MAG: acyltransferase, partial [Flavobacteriales bacterium]|nr:acyltransferase [Flavobacteriales bacterium]
MFRALAGFIYFKLLGWRVEDHRPPGLKQYIVVVAPHTSNWDFPIGVLVRSICRMNDVRYL